jgi:hypothetical protein
MMALKKLGVMQCIAEKSVETSTAGNGNCEGKEGFMAENAEEKAGSKERES